MTIQASPCLRALSLLAAYTTCVVSTDDIQNELLQDDSCVPGDSCNLGLVQLRGQKTTTNVEGADAPNGTIDAAATPSNVSDATLASASGRVPSTVPYCPEGFKDCGTCRCVPESTCRWCPGDPEYNPYPAYPPPPIAPPPEANSSGRVPSTVPYCPESFKDCGTCLCVPESTCRWCPGDPEYNPYPAIPPPLPIAPPLEANSSGPVPSTVPYCPEGFKDCGTCLCVPETTCRWCPGDPEYNPYPAIPPPPPIAPPPDANATGRVPSTVPYCPEGFKDCGTCLCVPESTCHWCPGDPEYNPYPAYPPLPIAPPPDANATGRVPSTVPYCPESFKDCGTCLCVPESTCKFCPGDPDYGHW